MPPKTAKRSRWEQNSDSGGFNQGGIPNMQQPPPHGKTVSYVPDHFTGLYKKTGLKETLHSQN